MSYSYAPGRTLDLSFGLGLTPDTPNLQLSVGLPFRMSLWVQAQEAAHKVVAGGSDQSFAGHVQIVRLELSKRLISIRIRFRCEEYQPRMASVHREIVNAPLP